MSKRRMFSQAIIGSDVFLDMPLSSQMLYVHLSMEADDYGFVSPKRVMRMVGAGTDDLQILIAKRYVLSFDSGVVVIKHWQINNTVRKDRSKDTSYQLEFNQLTYNEFGAYTEKRNLRRTIKTPLAELQQSKVLNNDINENDNQMATQIRLDKIRLNTGAQKKVPKSEIAKLYYEAVEALDAPVRNHNNLHNKIREMENSADKEQVIKYLLFMRDTYKNLVMEFKPHINEGLDIFAKRKQIENLITKHQTSRKEFA